MKSKREDFSVGKAIEVSNRLLPEKLNEDHQFYLTCLYEKDTYDDMEQKHRYLKSDNLRKNIAPPARAKIQEVTKKILGQPIKISKTNIQEPLKKICKGWEKIEDIIILLRTITKDESIQVIDVEDGSTIITIKASDQGIKQINNLFNSGELAKEMNNKLGVNVQDIEFLEEVNQIRKGEMKLVLIPTVQRGKEDEQKRDNETINEDLEGQKGIIQIVKRNVFEELEAIYAQKNENNIINRPKPFNVQEWVTILVGYLNSYTDTAGLLCVDDVNLKALIGGYAKSRISPNELKSIINKIQDYVCHEIFRWSYDQKIDILKVSPNRLLRISNNGKFNNLCRCIIEGYFIEETLETKVEKVISQYNNAFEDNKSRKRKLRKEIMREIYKEIGTFIPPSRFNAFARKSFQKQTWNNIIHTSQVDKDYLENHLHYSNNYIALEIFSRLRRLIERDKKDFTKYFHGYIRILEGGVGGANTTQMVLRRLKDLWEKEDYSQSIRDLMVEYLGYEINPTFVARTIDFFKGKVSSDSRSQLFDKFRLRPWNEQSQFILAQDMVEGIGDLEQKGIYNKSVHIFICSYAFHHVPNGKDLNNHLFFQANNIKIDSFIASIKNNLTSNFASQEVAKSLRARTLGEYVRNPEKQDINVFCRSLKDVLGKNTPTDTTQEFINHFLMNPQLETLRKIRNLLVPGGIIAIADPDGMSNFNATQVLVDPEMVVAHFLKREEIVDLLKQAHFDNIKSCTVGKTKHDKEEYRFDIVDKPNDPDFEDDNLGYIVFAQRPLL